MSLKRAEISALIFFILGFHQNNNSMLDFGATPKDEKV